MQHGTAENVSSVGMIIVIVLLVVSIYKMLKSFHPTMVLFVLGILGVGVFLYWVHNRNEPPYMTPTVDAVAQFCPKRVS